MMRDSASSAERKECVAHISRHTSVCEKNTRAHIAADCPMIERTHVTRPTRDRSDLIIAVQSRPFGLQWRRQGAPARSNDHAMPLLHVKARLSLLALLVAPRVRCTGHGTNLWRLHSHMRGEVPW